MPQSKAAVPKRRFQFSLRTTLVAMIWVAVFCLFRTLVLRNQLLNGAEVRAMWGGMFLAGAASAFGASSAHRVGASPAKVFLRGTLLGAAAATLFLTMLVVEVVVGVAIEIPELLTWLDGWLTLGQIILHNGLFVGSITAAVVATLWLIRPLWRYAIIASASAIILMLGWQFALEVTRARAEELAFQEFAGEQQATASYEPTDVVGSFSEPLRRHLQHATRVRVFEKIVAIRLANDRTKPPGVTDWSQLPKLKNVRKLELHYTGLADEDLAYIAAHEKLEELWLTEPAITDAGLERLQRLRNLATLALSKTRTTDAGDLGLLTTLPDIVIEHRPAPVPSADPDAAPAPPSLPAAP